MANTVYIVLKEYGGKLALIIAASICIAVGLDWLAFAIAILIVTYYGLVALLKRVLNPGYLRGGINILRILLLVSASIFSQIFIFSIFSVPSDSMQRTLEINDVIFVNKLIYGPRLTNSLFDLAWLSDFGFLQRTANEKFGRQHRASGLSEIEAGDVVVYNLNSSYVVVKRCVALAGDTIEIDNGKVLVNQTETNFSANILDIFDLAVHDKALFANYLRVFDKDKRLLKIDTTTRSMLVKLTAWQVDSIRKRHKNIQLQNAFVAEYSNQEPLFVKPPRSEWHANNMGPIRVPRRDMQITLTPENIRVYGQAIERFEQVNIRRVGNTYFIGDIPASEYKFRNNYYFMLGDNRNKSSDSRFHGFIPDFYIIGKATKILYSFDKNSLGFDRLFQEIN